MHAAFALHRLENDCRNVATLQLPLERGRIAKRHGDATFEEWLERRAMADAARHRQSAERGPMVAALRGDETPPARCRTRQLERALDRLRTAGAKRAQVEIAGRDSGEAPGQLRREPLGRNQQEMRWARLQHLF